MFVLHTEAHTETATATQPTIIALACVLIALTGVAYYLFSYSGYVELGETY